MKTKILLIGFQAQEQTSILANIKKWKKKFEVVFAQYDINAIDEIAKTQKREKIRGLIFHRNILISYPQKCKLILDFANLHQKKPVVAINIIWSDQDRTGRDSAVSEFFAAEEDWKQVETILNNKI